MGLMQVGDFETSDKIYRIFRARYFLDLLKQEQVCFVRPKLWDDPYENFFLQQDIIWNGEKVKLDKARNERFGQCWTYNQETDFMWRVYAPCEIGIKVESTIENLKNNLLQDISNPGSLSIGRVDYFTKQEIIHSSESMEEGDIIRIVWSKPDLFIKRKTFEHEKEFRFIYTNAEISEKQDKVFIQAKPDNFIDKIVLDPRSQKKEIEDLQSEIKDIMTRKGYNIPVEISDLYSPPDFDVIVQDN